ncbi:hypothetical protein JTB14_032304 [Gonioctena quinquepunctata]|nr:hypothetical protein JTB14_032304 [Gonioctena quinquepunctata]
MGSGIALNGEKLCRVKRFASEVGSDSSGNIQWGFRSVEIKRGLDRFCNVKKLSLMFTFLEVVAASINPEGYPGLWENPRSQSSFGFIQGLSGKFPVHFPCRPEHDTVFLLHKKRMEILTPGKRNSPGGDQKLISDLRRIVGDRIHTKGSKRSLQQISGHLLYGNRKFFQRNHTRADLLASTMGSFHMSISIDKAVFASWTSSVKLLGCYPDSCKGRVQAKPLQNIKPGYMVLSYLLHSSCFGRRKTRGLLVLGSSTGTALRAI